MGTQYTWAGALYCISVWCPYKLQIDTCWLMHTEMVTMSHFWKSPSTSLLQQLNDRTRHAHLSFSHSMLPQLVLQGSAGGLGGTMLCAAKIPMAPPVVWSIQLHLEGVGSVLAC